MSRYRKIINRIFASCLFLLLVSFHNSATAADGEALFKANCANCHKPDADYTGPALKGWKDRIPDPEWIYKWVANPAAMNDPYATKLKDKWKPIIMTGFGSLKKDEIDAILKYVDDIRRRQKPEAEPMSQPPEHRQPIIPCFSVS